MDEKKSRERKRKQRIRQRRIQIFKRIVLVMLILGILCGGTYAIVVNVFRVKNISFSGNTWNSDEDMKKYIFKDKYDYNSIVIAFKSKYMKKPQIPYVETYELKVNWPDDIVINVYEKKIMGYVKNGSANMYFDKDGIVVDTSEEVLKNVPEVVGIKTGSIVLHQPINTKMKNTFVYVTEIKQQLDKHKLSVEKIVFEEGELYMKSDDIKIKMGQPEYLTEKVFEYSQLVSKLKGKKGTLHLENCTGQPMNIHFTQE